MHRLWVLTDRDDTVISCLPKNGSSSIRTIRDNEDRRTTQEAMGYKIRIGIIREPIQRLRSMYKFLKGQHDSGATLLQTVPTASYEAFVDHTLEWENHHWKPQVELLETPEGQWVPTQCYRFEEINNFWPKYFDVPLPHKNSSPVEYAVNEYKREELESKYRRDIDLWQSLGN